MTSIVQLFTPFNMKVHTRNMGCDLQSRCDLFFKVFVELTVKHAIAYAVYMRSHVQVSSHPVEGMAAIHLEVT